MGKAEAEATAQAIEAGGFSGALVGAVTQACEAASGKTFQLKLRYLDRAGEPRAGIAYRLVAGAQVFEATTDLSGGIEHELPAGCTIADLTFDHELTWRVHVGPMASAKSPSGAQARLCNLGFGSADAVRGMLDRPTRDALKRLQHIAELAENGVCDGPTSAELEKRYGS